jgi:hypothetical protein
VRWLTTFHSAKNRRLGRQRVHPEPGNPPEPRTPRRRCTADARRSLASFSPPPASGLLSVDAEPSCSRKGHACCCSSSAAWFLRGRSGHRHHDGGPQFLVEGPSPSKQSTCPSKGHPCPRPTDHSRMALWRIVEPDADVDADAHRARSAVLQPQLPSRLDRLIARFCTPGLRYPAGATVLSHRVHSAMGSPWQIAQVELRPRRGHGHGHGRNGQTFSLPHSLHRQGLR